ncbi:MAG TPA: SEC-C metal-binding domain-containing protein [Armatimonadota bacterium]|nr:SEC-C metal-binding domain-containing protein [Armatimonadota bacterium]
MAFLASFFDHTKKDVARSWKTVEKINALRPQIEALSDEELKAKTTEFKERLANGTELDDLLPEAFAVVREAAWRVLGRRQYRFWVQKTGIQATGTSALEEIITSAQQRKETEDQLHAAGRTFTVEKYMEPFDVQMIGGIMLHKGMIAEMKTGEGKTLVAASPVYLNALSGHGVHLVTVNDYLVRYQGTLMGELYHFLGLVTGMTQSGRGDGSLPAYIYTPGYSEPDGLPNLRPVHRREAYQADILYTTNNEIGFDYLRDNMALDMSQLSQRELHYAIVDEVDSILVDEARTPLIISGPGAKPTELYGTVDHVIRNLRPETDYIVDEKSKTATLTEDGLARVENGLGVENISDPANLQLFQHVQAAVRAHGCYRRDIDYIVKEGEVIIVDEFTGRLMFGRRYSEGLHQAIEAKENVKVERESQTLATITFQNYFRLYDKLAGMTGTAKTEEQEFIKIYGLPVAVIPTHRPVGRRDYPDVVYKTEEAKLRGLIGEILQCEAQQQPVLVGTRSIEFSERVSERLKADLLQAFTLASILHRHILELKKLDQQQQAEFAAVLKLRSADQRKEREHLQAALEKMELYANQKSLRLVQPEEIRQLENRLERATALENEINTLHDKAKAGADLSSGEMRRLAEIICFQRLENVRTDRLSKLMEVCGLPSKATDQQNVERIGRLINLTSDFDRLSNLLARGVPHKVLNAKYHEQEAEIIAQAGRPGAVTIATNMAGRGVDIMLGGNPSGLVDEILSEQGILQAEATPEQRDAALEEARRSCNRDRELVVSRGGLAIIGTERHESRRIDNQLRGRSGRQGDPGQSRFYVSMQDELMRLFGPERFDFLHRGWEESEPIEAKMITRLIENAQRKVESHNFEIRQHVLKYDDVMNLQREVIYKQRRQVLEGENIKSSIIDAIEKAVSRRINEHAGESTTADTWDIDGLSRALLEVCPQLPLFYAPEDMRYGPSSPLLEAQHNIRIWQHYIDGLKTPKAYSALLDDAITHVQESYDRNELEQGEDNMRLLERLVTLRIIDNKWINHLDAMDFLREGISLRGYAQVDPLVAYTNEAYDMWNQLMADIQEDIATNIFRVRLMVEEEEHKKSAYKPTSTNQSDEGPSQGVRVANAGVGRNDPCPCGSGKKYKKCCGMKTGSAA